METLDRSIDYIMNIDLSPINYEQIKKNVVNSVNSKIGLKDGGNIKISQGKVLYPDDFLERKKSILSFNAYED